MPPVIALIGRPNVGKSTLFNRLLRRRKAITHDRPGVTRDRMEAVAVINGRQVTLVDTGGMLPGTASGIEALVTAQARQALGMADLCLLVTDAREGLTPLDAAVAESLRQAGKSALVVVNKADGEEQEDRLAPEFFALGFPLIAVSAAHGRNLHDLADLMLEMLPGQPDFEVAEKAPEVLRLALIGRPNAGKSSIVNALAGKNRVIVSDTPGTTRDAVDVTIAAPSGPVTFVDTAGVRRKSRIEDGLEKLSVGEALKSARRAHVCCLVLDAPAGLCAQDKKLISFLDQEKVPFLVLANKTDLVAKADLAAFKKELTQALSLCRHAPVLFVSAQAGSGLGQIVTRARSLYAECGKRAGTGELNRAAREALARHQAPMVKGRRAKFYYLTQSGTHPPTFVFFVNDPERVTAAYARYLENTLRKILALAHAPLKLVFRGSHGEAEK